MSKKRIPVDPVTAEQMMPWLQHHIVAWTAYAFALARRAHLAPEEAARLFMQPVIDAGQARFQADAARLGQQAMQNAVILSALHGAQQVCLEQEDDAWHVQLRTEEIQQELAAWDVPLDFFARWLGEQARLIGEPKGIRYTWWLDDEALHLQLTLMPAD
jgi:hypothetical protein